MLVKIYLLRNDRLLFRDSEKKVIGFITSRLKNAGFFNVEIINDRKEFEEKSQRSDGISALVRAMNPFVDIELLNRSVALLQKSATLFKVTPVGCVGGTEVDEIIRRKTEGSIDTVLHWETQQRFNNQFNLFKFKRLKVFLSLSEKYPEIVNYKISELNAFLEKDEVFHFILDFAPGEAVRPYHECLHCSQDIEALYPSQGHPLIGYIPQTRSYYSRCLTCGLIFLNPGFAKESIPHFYDVFDREDFSKSLNSPYVEGSKRCELDFLGSNLENKTLKTLDLGGGMGFFSSFLKTKYKNFDVNHSDFEIKAEHDHLAQLGINSLAINFLDENITGKDYDLITMWEVLEHIPFDKISSTVEKIHHSLKSGGYFVFSTPDYDSPLCKAIDFYYTAPPFHITCFSRSWLKTYFSSRKEWEIERVTCCSDLLDDYEGWTGYESGFAPGNANRSLFNILKSFSKSDVPRTFKKAGLRKSNWD